uniref:Tyr recombinase domain-containing protein n=1 Tax=Macrostomum lignano TaxID=282301 RepID=A0A1I8FHB9_9PLAT
KDMKDNEDFLNFLHFLESGNTADDLPLLPAEDDAPAKEDGENETEPKRVPLDMQEAMTKDEIVSLPTKTREQMIAHGNGFVQFLREHGAAVHELSRVEMCEFLRYYYYQLRRHDGGPYSPASLVCIRAGIQRFLTMVAGLTINIIDGEEFVLANRMLRMKVREWHNSGGQVRSYPPIEEGDMEKLRTYFDRSSAETTQDEFLFRVMYGLGERGREHLESIESKKWLVKREDSDGRPYYALPVLNSKNKSADPNRAKRDIDVKQARIYDVGIVDDYMAILPTETKNDSLFPRPLKNAGGTRRFCSKQKRGINYLRTFMKALSKKAKLSKEYTNHSIRLSRVCDLESAGHSMSEIMAITGQKSESTVRRYLAVKRDKSLQQCSDAVEHGTKRRDPRSSNNAC